MFSFPSSKLIKMKIVVYATLLLEAGRIALSLANEQVGEHASLRRNRRQALKVEVINNIDSKSGHRKKRLGFHLSEEADQDWERLLLDSEEDEWTRILQNEVGNYMSIPVSGDDADESDGSSSAAYTLDDGDEEETTPSDGGEDEDENEGGDGDAAGEDTTRDGALIPGLIKTNLQPLFVVSPLKEAIPDVFDASVIGPKYYSPLREPTRLRKVAVFEGKDEYGRLMPLQGTAEPATDYKGDPIFWPGTEAHRKTGLAGKQMEGTMAWHEPTTENPQNGTAEEWEVWNLSGDAHPFHLHLVRFEILGREEIKWDSALMQGDDQKTVLSDPSDAVGDGTYLIEQPIVQHDGALGSGFRVGNPTKGDPVATPEFHYEDGPNDMVTALPGQVTRFKTYFDKPGRFVWHCHILAHEDHEMMRVLQVSE